MSQQIVIIGAGPTGLLLAHYLLRQGPDRITLYERRPDPRWLDVSQDRTFPISLQARGRNALRAIPGLEAAIMADSVFCNGTIIHRHRGGARRIPRQQPILSVDRNRLTRVMLEHLVAMYPPERVTVQFNCDCTEVDIAASTVTIQPQQAEAMTVAYDRLVGADGARSQVRQSLVQQSNLQCDQQYVSDHYKSVFLSLSNPDLGIALEPDKIHALNLDHKTRMLMVPQPNNRLHGVIIFNAEQNPLAALSTPAAVLAYFQKNFPVFGQLMSQAEATALLQRPVGRVLTVRCDRLHHSDRILLLGDAVHAVSPSIGQGCNASLEDVMVFARVLERYGQNWAQALPAFSQDRIADAHALQDLSNYSFPRTKLLVLEFFLRLTLGRLLHRWFPQRVQPFLFDLVLDTDMPYSQVLNLNASWLNKVKQSLLKT